MVCGTNSAAKKASAYFNFSVASLWSRIPAYGVLKAFLPNRGLARFLWQSLSLVLAQPPLRWREFFICGGGDSFCGIFWDPFCGPERSWLSVMLLVSRLR